MWKRKRKRVKNEMPFFKSLVSALVRFICNICRIASCCLALDWISLIAKKVLASNNNNTNYQDSPRQCREGQWPAHWISICSSKNNYNCNYNCSLCHQSVAHCSCRLYRKVLSLSVCCLFFVVFPQTLATFVVLVYFEGHLHLSPTLLNKSNAPS